MTVRRKSWRVIPAGWAIWLFLSLLLSSPESWAEATTPAQARQLVQAWLSLNPQPLGAGLGGQVLEVQSYPPEAAAPDYFIVLLNPQGFVVVAADDLVEPLIAFAPSGRYDPSPDSPLGALVGRDVPGRVTQVREMERQARKKGLEFPPAGLQAKARSKWQALTQTGAAALRQPEASLPAVSDLRVAPFWEQVGPG
jgi:hypothetical protein